MLKHIPGVENQDTLSRSHLLIMLAIKVVDFDNLEKEYAEEKKFEQIYKELLEG